TKATAVAIHARAAARLNCRRRTVFGRRTHFLARAGLSRRLSFRAAAVRLGDAVSRTSWRTRSLRLLAGQRRDLPGDDLSADLLARASASAILVVSRKRLHHGAGSVDRRERVASGLRARAGGLHHTFSLSLVDEAPIESRQRHCRADHGVVLVRRDRRFQFGLRFYRYERDHSRCALLCAALLVRAHQTHPRRACLSFSDAQ